MCRRHEQTLGLSTYSSFFVMLVAVQAARATTCDELQCLNSNPCLSFVAPDNTTHARCVCSGKWAGPRCGRVIRLEPERVTSSDVRLKITLTTSPSYDVTMASRPGGGPSSSTTTVSLKFLGSDEARLGLNYTLVYWRRNDTVTSTATDSFLTSGEISCVLLQNMNARKPSLLGLTPRMRYTICVENGFLDSCLLASFADAPAMVPFPPSPQLTALQPDLLSSSASSSSSSSSSSWPSNCVTIFTQTPSSSSASAAASAGFIIGEPSTVRAVAVVSVLILVLLIVVFVVFLARRQSVSVRVFVDTLFCGWRWCCCCCCCRCSSASSHPGGGGDNKSEADGRACNNNTTKPSCSSSSSSADSGSSRLSHSQSFKLRSASFLDEEEEEEDGEGSRSAQRRTLKRRVLDRLQRKKKQRSSTYKTANMLLPPPASPASSSLLPLSDESRRRRRRLRGGLESAADEGGGGHDELSPLDPDLSDDGAFENASGGRRSAAEVDGAGPAHHDRLPAIHKAGSKPRHRLSRKRRSYVAYSTKKDRNIRLTTVLESPLDDHPYGGSGLGVDVDDLTLHDYGEPEDDFNTI